MVLVRYQSAFPSILQFLVVSLLATAVYGDLIKRILPGSVALVVLYIVSCLLIIGIFVCSKNYIFVRQNLFIAPFAFLLGLYFLQSFFVASIWDIDIFFNTASFLLYFTIPILCLISGFLIGSIQYLWLVAVTVSVIMVPHHIVGAVQLFTDPNFLTSDAYAEHSGIITRSFLDTSLGVYLRLPALFVSADRYAGACAAQLCLFLVVFSRSKLGVKNLIFLTFLMFALPLLGSLASGVRSRMLLAYASVILGIIVWGTTHLLSVHKLIHFGENIWKILYTFLIVLLVIFFFMVGVWDLPSVKMLIQTFLTNDFSGRFYQMFVVSLPPEGLSSFGRGIGALGARPQEFGLKAMWQESGYLFSPLMIFCYLICFGVVAAATLNAIFLKKYFTIPVLIGFGGFWIFGMLAGFSSNFELTIGTILFFATGVSLKISLKTC